MDVSIVIPVFRPGKDEIEAFSKIRGIVESLEKIVEIIIVNDSSVSLPDSYKSIVDSVDLCRVINCRENGGRSCAINIGCFAARGAFCWILDADCWPTTKAIDKILNLRLCEVDVYMGQVQNNGSSFWSHYQMERRATNKTVSTANVLIKTELFKKLGGFDTSYRWYGFEDQDLLCRIPSQVTKIVDPEFEVVHVDEPSLGEIRKKMRESAYSGAIFKQKYPDVYIRMAYAKVDCAIIAPSMRIILCVLVFMEKIMFPALEKIVSMKTMPYLIKYYIVLFVSAVNYFSGSREADKVLSSN